MRMPSSNLWSNSSPRSARSSKAPCRNCSPARQRLPGFSGDSGEVKRLQRLGIRVHRDRRPTGSRSHVMTRIEDGAYPLLGGVLEPGSWRRIDSYSHEGRCASSIVPRTGRISAGTSTTSTAIRRASTRLRRHFRLSRGKIRRVCVSSTCAQLVLAATCRDSNVCRSRPVDSAAGRDVRRSRVRAAADRGRTSRHRRASSPTWTRRSLRWRPSSPRPASSNRA